MRIRARSLLAFIAAAAFARDARAIDVGLELVAPGFSRPIFVTHAGDGSGRLFVVQQTGLIRIIHPGGNVDPTPFLDASGIVSQTIDERGLLGMAFHPDYAANGRFFISYTATPADPLENHPSFVVEYKVSDSDPDIADPNPVEVILGPIQQPFSNHNGGMIAFGPDGLFYYALGDGGFGGDPFDNAQNLGTLLGKILRINVDIPGERSAYSIPADNFFEADGDPGTLGEIYAYGLRNPWRFSFDRLTGWLYCGDVGQQAREEIDLIWNGANYGWRVMEGSICYLPPTGCDTTGLNFPIAEYEHTQDNVAITGGYVYRGEEYPGLKGLYFYADSGLWKIFALRQTHPGLFEQVEVLNPILAITSFGEDEEGELYVCDYGNGRILKIVDNDPPPAAAKIPWQLAE